MVRKLFFFTVMSLTLVLFTLNCRQKKQATTGQEEAQSKKKIAVVISTLNNPWFVVLGNTAKERAEQLGYDVTIFDSQNDTAKESDHFDNIITGGYVAILFNPTDADGSIANVRKSKEAELGQYFVQRMNEKGKYVELLGILGDNNTWNRSKGFHSVVDNYPELKMVAQQTAEFDRTKAMEVLESILQANPDINAVFCGNDAMAMGAYQALVAAGKADKVMVFGFDGAKDVIDSVHDGKIAATGMQFPKRMARMAAEQADEYIRGKRDFPQKVPVAVELVTQENIAKYTAYGRQSED
jgi:ribose transport system substrate-binding protein